MEKQQYALPMIIKIESDNPNMIMEEVAKAIYDAVDAYVHAEGFDNRVKFFDIEYSIHKKMSDEDFITKGNN